MTAVSRAEIAAALNDHRLASSNGWRNEDGSITYTCACGHTLNVGGLPHEFVPIASLQAQHQASVIEDLGFARRADTLDQLAFHELAGLLEQRKSIVDAGLHVAHTSDANAERQRLDGASSELSLLWEAVASLVRLRLSNGRVELPIDEIELSIA